MSKIRSVIIGSGSYIPEEIVGNKDFLKNTFYTEGGKEFENSTADIVEKFFAITGISERRYAGKELMNSDMAASAAKKAIAAAGIDPETLDQIIVAQNFGDVSKASPIPDMVPSIASRVKHKIGVHNPYCSAYDLIFGCPGWIQAMINANMAIKCGNAKRILVIGSETLSRVADPFDRDSMIYSDGAGAVILEAVDTEDEIGILQSVTMSHTDEEVLYLMMGQGYYEDTKHDNYMKMNGRKIYNYALTHVPNALKLCIEKTGLDLSQIDKLLIHQANAKMDMAIVERLFKLYDCAEIPDSFIPMSIDKLGNNSVATVPMLYDLISKSILPNHTFSSREVLLFASVGAGMNINAFSYRIP